MVYSKQREENKLTFPLMFFTILKVPTDIRSVYTIYDCYDSHEEERSKNVREKYTLQDLFGRK